VSRPGTFQKGRSGDPGGRPKAIAEVKALARKQTTIAINTLVAIAKSNKATDAARVSACIALLDRGRDKPDKTHHHDGDIRQHIISDRPLTPDEWKAKYCRASTVEVSGARPLVLIEYHEKLLKGATKNRWLSPPLHGYDRIVCAV
jgi:hypothetical protein